MSKELEALECSLKLYKMVESAGNNNGFNLNEAWEYNKIIKQALIKAQEQEKKLKALEIIKEKKVNMYHIWVFDNYQQYKEHYPFSEYHAIEDMLTFKEFIFLKEVKDNE